MHLECVVDILESLSFSQSLAYLRLLIGLFLCLFMTKLEVIVSDLKRSITKIQNEYADAQEVWFRERLVLERDVFELQRR